MIGHDVTLSETNSHGWVPLCECGWIGTVSPMLRFDPAAPARLRTRIEITKSIALDAHKLHTYEVRAEIARASDARLAAIGSDIKAANLTLQRRGRWGNG